MPGLSKSVLHGALGALAPRSSHPTPILRPRLLLHFLRALHGTGDQEFVARSVVHHNNDVTSCEVSKLDDYIDVDMDFIGKLPGFIPPIIQSSLSSSFSTSYKTKHTHSDHKGRMQIKASEVSLEILIHKCFMGRVEHYNIDSKDREAYAGRILGLLNQMRQKGHIPTKQIYKKIMAWFSAMAYVAEFQKVVEWMKEDNIDFGDEFKSYEVELWLKAGKISKAKNLHNGTEGNDAESLSWLVAKLQAFSRTDRVKDLCKLLEQIDATQISCISTFETFESIFHCLGKSGKHKACMKLSLVLMEKGDFSARLDGFLASYAEGLAKRLKDSEQLHKDMKSFLEIVNLLKLKPSTAFDSLIDCCCRQGEIKLAVQLIKEMTGSGMKLSECTFLPFMRHFSTNLNVFEAEDMLAAMGRSGVRGTQSTYQHLISAYARSDKIREAYDLIAEMIGMGLSPTASMYNPIIQAYGLRGELHNAFNVLQEMENAGVKPDSASFAKLIQACAYNKNQALAMKLFKTMDKRGLEIISSVIAAMVSTHMACGDLEKAQQIMSDQRYAGKIGIETKSAYLAGLATNGYVEQSLSLFNDMRKCGMWPSFNTFKCLLGAVGSIGNLDDLFKLFNMFRAAIESTSQKQQDEQLSIACAIVVIACIHHHQLGRAIEFLQQIQKESIGDVEILCAGVFLYHSENSKEDGNLIKQRLEDKFLFLKAMGERLHLQPLRIAFEALLLSCAKERDGSRAFDVITMMRKENLQFSILTFIIMFQAFVAAGDAHMAKEVLQQMKRTMANKGWEDEDVKLMISRILKPFRQKPNTSDEKAFALYEVSQLASQLFIAKGQKERERDSR